MAHRPPRPASPALGLALVLLVLGGLTGCGNGDGDSTNTSGTADTAEPSVTAGPSDTADTAGSGGSGGSTNDQASGSGCTPGTETGLPDGRWFGFVETAGDGRVEFDLACWFEGDAAIAAAAEDGAESPPPNDYHIRNANTLVRTLDVVDGTMVTWYPEMGDPGSEQTAAFDEWATARLDRAGGQLGVWLQTSDGAVTAIEEQWVP